MVSQPSISVIIPTCNRPDDMKRNLNSLSRVEYPSWEVIVVDQSDDTSTQEIVKTFDAVLPGLRYIHVNWKNCSNARNVAIEVANGEILACLDDDCVVYPDYLMQAACVIERYPQAGHIYGELRIPKGMSSWSVAGWIPTRFFPVEFEAKVLGHFVNRLRLPDLVGNGACLFVRRESTRHAGLFDVHLGGGGRFPTAEDGEYTNRALMAGYSVVGTPNIFVDHYGIRDIEDGAAARLARAYQYGAGAWLMKSLRLGDPFALAWIVVAFVRYISEINPRAIISGRGPKGLAASVMFVLGMIKSFELNVDRQRKTYAARTMRSGSQRARRTGKA
jgi:GT2 family glycosyltransferase